MWSLLGLQLAFLFFTRFVSVHFSIGLGHHCKRVIEAACTFSDLQHLYTVQLNIRIFMNSRVDEEGEVKLENVWFSYPSRPKDLVLKVSFGTLSFTSQIAWTSSLDCCCVF